MYALWMYCRINEPFLNYCLRYGRNLHPLWGRGKTAQSAHSFVVRMGIRWSCFEVGLARWVFDRRLIADAVDCIVAIKILEFGMVF